MKKILVSFGIVTLIIASAVATLVFIKTEEQKKSFVQFGSPLVGSNSQPSRTIEGSVSQLEIPAGWKTHTNKEIGFSFEYPQGWKVQDSLTKNTCCLDTFSSLSPYDATGDHLKPGVTTTQFHYSEYKPMSNEQEFISRLIKDNEESVAMGEPSGLINKESIFTFNTISGLKVIKFDTGTGHSVDGIVSVTFGYAILQGKDFSKIVYIYAEQDPVFEKVISTFKFTSPSKQASLPTTCVDQDEGVPVITYISSYSIPVGSSIEIRGCNFSGFEADENAWLENSQGVRGLVFGEVGSTEKLLKLIIVSPLCTEDTSYSGKQCGEWLNLTPGEYKIYTEPWGKKSNEVSITIK